MGVEVLLGSSSFAGCYSMKLVMGTAEPVSGLDQTAITLCALTVTCHLTDITECTAVDRSVSFSASEDARLILCRVVMRTAELVSSLDQTAITLCALTMTCHLTGITECNAMDHSVSFSAYQDARVILCRLVVRTAEPVSSWDQTALTLCALTMTCHLTDITECSAMDHSVLFSASEDARLILCRLVMRTAEPDSTNTVCTNNNLSFDRHY